MQIVSFLWIVLNPVQPSVSENSIDYSKRSIFCFSDMPVLEDGLSDSENISGDERSSPPVLPKSTNRHQSTQIDLNHSPSIPSHKHQHAKSEVETQSKSFYIRPPQMPSATAQNAPSEDSSTIATGS